MGKNNLTKSETEESILGTTQQFSFQKDLVLKAYNIIHSSGNKNKKILNVHQRRMAKLNCDISDRKLYSNEAE